MRACRGWCVPCCRSVSGRGLGGDLGCGHGFVGIAASCSRCQQVVVEHGCANTSQRCSPLLQGCWDLDAAGGRGPAQAFLALLQHVFGATGGSGGTGGSPRLAPAPVVCIGCMRRARPAPQHTTRCVCRTARLVAAASCPVSFDLCLTQGSFPAEPVGAPCLQARPPFFV